MNLSEICGEPIDIRTRADAIKAGDLVEVPTDTAQEAGFTTSVALTRAVWEDCVAWGDADAEHTGALQDEEGRLWDVLWLAARAFRSANGVEVAFAVYRVARDSRPGPDGDIEATPTHLVASLTSEGVTIAQPNED
jgi:hypothetical protein